MTARSADGFTLSDQDRMPRINFDYRSYSDDDPILPPESVDLA